MSKSLSIIKEDEATLDMVINLELVKVAEGMVAFKIILMETKSIIKKKEESFASMRHLVNLHYLILIKKISD